MNEVPVQISIHQIVKRQHELTHLLNIATLYIRSLHLPNK